MSLTTITVQQIVRTGLTPVLAAANTDGSYVANDGRMWLEVANTGAEMTVTVETPNTVDGLAIGDLAVVIPATTGKKHIGPFPPGTYNQPDGTIKVTFTRASDVTIGAFRA
ncbi:conserved hypothetical protein [Gammaproteobacteria bacterium]